LKCSKEADDIFIEGLIRHVYMILYGRQEQYFFLSVLVGVMGDERTYENAVVLRQLVQQMA